MNRETFLARVRDAARQGSAYRVHVRDLPPEVGYVGTTGDLCEAMAREVNAVGGIAEIVANRAAAREQLVKLMRQYRVHSALCWKHPVLDRFGLAKLLDERVIARLDYDEIVAIDVSERRELLLQADIGISSVDYAIAETGTLVVCARPGQERVTSLLPPVHVAIVEQSQIVPDLFDAFAALEKLVIDNFPSNITLITGPSKTGDIELQLTTGVHGPGKWYVLIVRDRR